MGAVLVEKLLCQGIPYYMKFSQHFNFANFTILKKCAKLKCHEKKMWEKYGAMSKMSVSIICSTVE